VIQEERTRQRRQDHKEKDTYGVELEEYGGSPKAGYSCYVVVVYKSLQGSGGLGVAISQLQVPRAAVLLEQ